MSALNKRVGQKKVDTKFCFFKDFCWHKTKFSKMLSAHRHLPPPKKNFPSPFYTKYLINFAGIMHYPLSFKSNKFCTIILYDAMKTLPWTLTRNSYSISKLNLFSETESCCMTDVSCSLSWSKTERRRLSNGNVCW